jgi:alkanesulfonate monooxygenase SsuD/methylene tetrahydromethanopterin reductase-like flavin-dependent oxidoreductase (luciferase family)
MRFGIWSPTNPREGVSMVELYRQQIEEVVVAEECGFDHYWFYEHHVSPSGPMPSPNLLIAAMLDTLTNGRLDWGVGRGLKPIEFDAFCVSQAKSREAFLEHMHVLTRVWADENFEFHGKHFHINKSSSLCPPVVQKPHPPIYVSAQSEESLRWAAENDALFCQIDALIEEARRDQEFYRSIQLAKGMAPQPRLIITREVYVAPTMEQARAEAQTWLLRYWQLWERYAQLTHQGRMPVEYQKWRDRAPMLAAMSFEELNERGLIMIGTPEHVAGRMIEHMEQLDLAAIACVFKFGGMPYDMVLRSMRLFSSEVMPRVRAAMKQPMRGAA